MLPALPLIAGGKSFGGRMTSQAQAISPLPGVRGLAFLGFPLHPAGKPSSDRAKHLAEVKIPMLFLQGTRDALAELSLLEPVVKGLGSRATLHLLEGADHSFHVLKSSGRNDREVMAEALDAFAAWVDGIDRLALRCRPCVGRDDGATVRAVHDTHYDAPMTKILIVNPNTTAR